MEAFKNSSVRQLLMQNKNKAVKLTVSKSGDTLFYNESRKAKIEQLKHPLPFTEEITITPLNNLPIGQVQFMKGSIMWKEESRTTKNNNTFRNLAIRDGEGEAVITIWNSDIDMFDNGKWYLFTNIDHSVYDADEQV